MARHPSEKEQFNYILDFFFDPCDAPLSLYVDAFLEASLRAVITYYALDPMQIFTSYVRPGGPLKGARGGNHGSKGSRKAKPKTPMKFWKRMANFDPSDWVGKNLPGQQEMSGRKIPGGAKWLWHAFNAEQRVVYWFFVYEIVQRWFYEAFLMVNNSIYCQEQRRPMILARRAFQGNIPILGRTPLTIQTIDKIRDITYADGNRIVVGTEMASYSITWGEIVMWDGEPMDGSEKIIMVLDNGTVIEPASMEGGGQSGSFAAVPNGMGCTFYMVGNRSYWVNDVVFTAWGHLDTPEVPPVDWRGLLGPIARI